MTTVPRAPAQPLPTWPMTTEAWSRINEEIAELRAHVLRLASEVGADVGVTDLELTRALRRLETLTQVLADGAPVAANGAAVIGCRVVLAESDGVRTEYVLVPPGDGDPRAGRVSADSPLGSAILGRAVGTRVEVQAPAGNRSVMVLAVE